MRIILQIFTATVFLAIMAIWLGSLRIVVVPAVSFAMNEGVALVYSGHDYRLLDSTTALCQRSRITDKECERTAALELASKVILKFPFSRSLHHFTLSGASSSPGPFESFALRS